MDHDLAALVDEDHEFEQVPARTGADDEPSVWVLADVFDRQWVCDGVLDVETLR